MKRYGFALSAIACALAACGAPTPPTVAVAPAPAPASTPAPPSVEAAPYAARTDSPVDADGCTILSLEQKQSTTLPAERGDSYSYDGSGAIKVGATADQKRFRIDALRAGKSNLVIVTGRDGRLNCWSVVVNDTK